MKGDLISRAEAVEMLMEKADCYAYKEAARIAIDCAGAVNNLPAVDAEPVRHGLWVEQERGLLNPVTCCSVCDTAYIAEMQGLTYCPHCGAKMDGGNADES